MTQTTNNSLRAKILIMLQGLADEPSDMEDGEGTFTTFRVEYLINDIETLISEEVSKKIQVKACTGCKETKPLSEYYLNHRYKGGYFHRCKACIKIRDIKRYAAKKEEIIKYIHNYRATHVEATSESQKRYYERNKEKVLARSRERAKSLPKETKLAYGKIGYLIKTGKLKKEPCTVCGSERSQAHHHYGYEGDNALNIIWLCSRHHGQVHSGKISLDTKDSKVKK